MRPPEKTLLTLAGFDPSGGAGVLLDLRVFSLHGFQGAAVLTSLTAQNTQAVETVLTLPASFVLKQFDTLAADLQIAGIKIGMLGGRRNIKTMKRILERTRHIPRVVDPVFRSSSGFWLLDKTSVPAYLAALTARASLFTPNIPEAELILGQKIKDVEGMKSAARRVYACVRIPCLLKGGHLPLKAADVFYDGRNLTVFAHQKIRKDVHGTGCFLSSTALACLAKGWPLERACREAVQQTVRALVRSRAVGRGRPVIPVFSTRSAGRQ